MNDEQAGALLERTRRVSALPAAWEPKLWLPIAVDRVGDVGAVAWLQRTSGGFFGMTAVYVRSGSRWSSVFDNGEQWPQLPADGEQPIAFMTSTTAFGLENGLRAAFVAGAVSADVERLAVAVADETRTLEPEVAGAFVALTLHAGRIGFRVEAVTRDGRRDAVEYAEPD